MTAIVHNVFDGRSGWIGSWEVEPLDLAKLTAADIGRTVIYRYGSGRAEAGTLTSWRGNLVFAQYSRGSTASGANASDLVFGIHRAEAKRSPLRCDMCGEPKDGRDHSGCDAAYLNTLR